MQCVANGGECRQLRAAFSIAFDVFAQSFLGNERITSWAVKDNHPGQYTLYSFPLSSPQGGVSTRLETADVELDIGEWEMDRFAGVLCNSMTFPPDQCVLSRFNYPTLSLSLEDGNNFKFKFLNKLILCTFKK